MGWPPCALWLLAMFNALRVAATTSGSGVHAPRRDLKDRGAAAKQLAKQIAHHVILRPAGAWHASP